MTDEEKEAVVSRAMDTLLRMFQSATIGVEPLNLPLAQTLALAVIAWGMQAMSGARLRALEDRVGGLEGAVDSLIELQDPLPEEG